MQATSVTYDGAYSLVPVCALNTAFGIEDYKFLNNAALILFYSASYHRSSLSFYPIPLNPQTSFKFSGCFS